MLHWCIVSTEVTQSCDVADIVGPGMDDGLIIEVIEVGEDPAFQFAFGCDVNMPEHRARHFGAEPFHNIEPRAVRGREDKGEAALPLRDNPCPGLLEAMDGMDTEDQLDASIGGISGVQSLEKAGTRPRPMALLDAGMHLTHQQINTGHQAQRTMA